MTIKQKIHAHYQQLVQDRIDAFKDMIAALAEDSRNDAKGSAGDKHETALAMMHIEQEKYNAKLREFMAQKTVLDRIDPLAAHNVIALGSLVKANGLMLYISAALPKIAIEGANIIALSPESPLGSLLMGKSAGNEIDVNTSHYKIEEVS